jgi:mono/diheme cytochrome c family protein
MLIRLVSLATIAFVLSTPALAEDASVTAGRKLAVAKCAGCHAVDMAGESPEPHAPPFRTFGPDFPFSGLRDALTQGMIVGHARMPVVHLSRTQSVDLTAYLKTLQTPGPARPRAQSRIPDPTHP